MVFQEWAEAEVKFREEAMEAERARQARLNAKSVVIEEVRHKVSSRGKT